MDYPVIRLNPAKEASAAHRHPWIFSGAVDSNASDDAVHGELVRVVGAKGTVLGTGTLSTSSSIAVRLFDFGGGAIDRAWFAARFREADARKRLLGFGPTSLVTGYRLLFGESDGVPGLVVDRYGDVLVIQCSTAGIEKLKDEIVAALKDVFAPRAIVERSDLPSRKDDGLKDAVGILFGDDPIRAHFTENDFRFMAEPLRGQKTGFFLDQRDLRAAITRFTPQDAEVLNLFSYTGASGVAAMKGGASRVLNVDASEDALLGCREHAAMNGINPDAFMTEAADGFQWFADRMDPAYDMVLMDPPALIKSRKDSEEGAKAYHFLNRAAMRLVKDGGIFVTSSCSHHFTEEDLAFVLRRASIQAGVTLHVLATVRQAADHPTSVYFPESAYLKTFICQVTR